MSRPPQPFKNFQQSRLHLASRGFIKHRLAEAEVVSRAIQFVLPDHGCTRASKTL